MHILVLHGPNLNLLGQREPEIYGGVTLRQVDRVLHEVAARGDAELRIVQSNHEGALIDEIHSSIGVSQGLLINAGGLTHTSVALRDAVVVGPPAVEVHLTNIYSREPVRHKSLLAPVCVGGVYGFGPESYRWGLEALLAYLAQAV